MACRLADSALQRPRTNHCSHSTLHALAPKFDRSFFTNDTLRSPRSLRLNTRLGRIFSETQPGVFGYTGDYLRRTIGVQLEPC